VSTTATPSARIDVPPDAAWRWFSLVLGGAAGLTLAAWCSAGLAWPAWGAAVSMAALAAAGAVVGLRTLRAPVGILRRHDEAWWWHQVGQPQTRPENGTAPSGHSEPCERGEAGHADLATEGGTQGDVVVTIDFGRWMLVRFEPVEAQDGVTARARTPRRRRLLWLPLSAGVAGGAAWSAWRALLLSRRATLPDRLRQPAVRAASSDR
jgi:hypothetical protein